MDLICLTVTADIFRTPQLEAALTSVKETFGPVDVLEYSPVPSLTEAAPVVDVTEENALLKSNTRR